MYMVISRVRMKKAVQKDTLKIGIDESKWNSKRCWNNAKENKKKKTAGSFGRAQGHEFRPHIQCRDYLNK